MSSYRQILVAIDPDRSETWAKASVPALALARCFGARLTLCSVVRDADAALEAEWSAIAYRRMVDMTRVRLTEIASSAGGIPIDVEVGTGNVCGGILEIAARIGADLIVLASHEPGLKDYLWSAHAARVARRAGCSVLIVRGEAARE